jgi:hypothetical protein
MLANPPPPAVLESEEHVTPTIEPQEEDKSEEPKHTSDRENERTNEEGKHELEKDDHDQPPEDHLDDPVPPIYHPPNQSRLDKLRHKFEKQITEKSKMFKEEIGACMKKVMKVQD